VRWFIERVPAKAAAQQAVELLDESEAISKQLNRSVRLLAL